MQQKRNGNWFTMSKHVLNIKMAKYRTNFVTATDCNKKIKS